jgi:hypothetical protein
MLPFVFPKVRMPFRPRNDLHGFIKIKQLHYSRSIHSNHLEKKKRFEENEIHACTINHVDCNANFIIRKT